MFFKKKPKHRESYYFEIIQNVEYMLRNQPNINDKLIILDYAIEVMKIELKGIVFSDILTGNKRFPSSNHDFDKLCPASKSTTEKLVDISLKNDDVLTLAWKPRSLIWALYYLKDMDFEHSTNIGAVYYDLLDMTIIHNGRHSSSAGIFFKQGTIKATLVDMTRLFDEIDTDGYQWIYLNSDIHPHTVKDYRLAVLFTLAKMKHELIVENNIQDFQVKYYRHMNKCQI